MSNREATDTITGYFYQFDKVILELLQQEDINTSICIEGIEDLDIVLNGKTDAIQCKYYAKTEYNHSVIKKPIQLMLKHYSNNKTKNIKYQLYGYFKSGQNKLSEVSIDNLKKNFLTYKKNETNKKTTHYIHEELKLTDDDLILFLKKLTIDIYAPSFEDQYKKIIDLIIKELGVTFLEADLYHYNSALKTIKNLAQEQNKKDRYITKKIFLNKIKAKDEIFHSWFIKRKGRENYIKSVKKQYLSNGLNMEPFNRFFLLDCNNSVDLVQIKHIILSISNKWSKVSNRESKKYCPSIYIHGLTINKIIELKNIIYKENNIFIDPYPFYGSTISLNHFYTIPTKENKIKFRYINTLEELKELIDTYSGPTIEIYQFYLNKTYFHNDTHKHVQIKIEDLTYIQDLIK
ncbi:MULTISPECIES: DUF4297 family anti-phage-associated protein [Proteus]|uniref:DUF4297 family anti-phage-associated protein n=2 Tax=Morganellaceae TaxID=1903414 RepID=UPI00148B3871|nr:MULTISPECIES: DUF4297 family anti-phage-associated protein [Proteus]MBI6406926.1 hypothetical protein [Proteus sp. PR00208]MDM3562672.1 hypothetical protein [Proteus vulgaris]QJW50464.1 hypothetical protein HND96_06020 [Proteus terrae subsp. cibarius]